MTELEDLADRALARLRDHPPTEAEIVAGGVDFVMGGMTERRCEVPTGVYGPDGVCGAPIVEVPMPCPDNIAGCAVYHFKYVCESGHPVAAEVVA